MKTISLICSRTVIYIQLGQLTLHLLRAWFSECVCDCIPGGLQHLFLSSQRARHAVVCFGPGRENVLSVCYWHSSKKRRQIIFIWCLCPFQFSQVWEINWTQAIRNRDETLTSVSPRKSKLVHIVFLPDSVEVQGYSQSLYSSLSQENFKKIVYIYYRRVIFLSVCVFISYISVFVAFVFLFFSWDTSHKFLFLLLEGGFWWVSLWRQ